MVVGLSGKDLRLGWSYGIFLLRVRGMGVGLGLAWLGPFSGRTWPIFVLIVVDLGLRPIDV